MKLQTPDEGDDEGDERGVGEHQEGGEVERPPVGRPGCLLRRRRRRARGTLFLRPRHACHRRRGTTGRQIQDQEQDEPSRTPRRRLESSSSIDSTAESAPLGGPRWALMTAMIPDLLSHGPARPAKDLGHGCRRSNALGPIYGSRHRRLLGRRRRTGGRRRGSVSLHDSVWADSDGHSLWAATTTVFLFLSHG